MKSNITGQTKLTLVLLITTVAAAIYLVSLKLAYPVFQNTRLVDPLASMHALFPLYYVAIAAMAVAVFICLIYRIQSKGIHLLLLILFATMLTILCKKL